MALMLDEATAVMREVFMAAVGAQLTAAARYQPAPQMQAQRWAQIQGVGGTYDDLTRAQNSFWTAAASTAAMPTTLWGDWLGEYVGMTPRIDPRARMAEGL